MVPKLYISILGYRYAETLGPKIWQNSDNRSDVFAKELLKKSMRNLFYTGATYKRRLMIDLDMVDEALEQCNLTETLWIQSEQNHTDSMT